MVRSLSVLTAALALLSAASAGAQQDYARNGFFLGVMGVFARERFNADVRSELNDQLAALGYAVDTDTDGSFGIEGILGYRFHRFFSVEVQGDWLFSFEGDGALTEPEASFPAGLDFIPEVLTTEFEIATVTANLKAHLLTGAYQPFLRVGGGVTTVKGEIKSTGRAEEERKSSGELRFPILAEARELGRSPFDSSDRQTDLAMRFGGGIEIYAFDTESFVISAAADYVLPFGDVEDFDYVSITAGFQYRF